MDKLASDVGKWMGMEELFGASGVVNDCDRTQGSSFVSFSTQFSFNMFIPRIQPVSHQPHGLWQRTPQKEDVVGPAAV